MLEIPFSRIFSQSGVIDILTYLQNKDNAILSNFIYDLKISAPTVMRAINILKEVNLIEEKQMYNRRFFKLTKKGEEIVKKLKEMEKILGEV